MPRFVQPDDVSCGPTCLQQVLHAYGRRTSYEEVDHPVRRLHHGGTLGVHLGSAALELGLRARVYAYNHKVFDPTWRALPPEALRRKLLARARATDRPRRREALRAYARFLQAGGRMAFPELTASLLARILHRGHPIVTGLSATHLYRAMRERTDDNVPDDIRGDPVGHFVVITGHDGSGHRFFVTDPSPHVPFARSGRYRVDADRLLNSILLGVTTYDGVLLEVWPGRGRRRP